MRISGGEFSGRIIKGSPGQHVRPTTDRARESFFNILQNKFDFSTIQVLDLFAGTGVVALEFLSRGTQKVVSIDINFKSIKFMQCLKQDFKVLERWDIYKANSIDYIEKNNINHFDVIYADPPYDWLHYQRFLNLVVESMSSNTLFCLEHQSNLKLPHDSWVESKVYGQSIISFYRK